MGDARGSGLKEVNSLISPHSKSSPINSHKFEGILARILNECQANLPVLFSIGDVRVFFGINWSTTIEH
jgi:hypothetical protein